MRGIHETTYEHWNVLEVENEKNHDREVNEKVEKILDEDILETWFSCPSCGEYTEINICSHCGNIFSATGEIEQITPSKKRENPEKENEKIYTIIPFTNGKTVKFFGAKTVFRTDILLHIEYNKIQYKIQVSPYIQRPIQEILVLGNKSFKKKWVENKVFLFLQETVKEILDNPTKYGISKLKALKS